MEIRRQIHVSGIVQGVGFRPYVYRLAEELRLAGYVTNTAAGVTIEVQGAPESVRDFLAILPAHAPPLARITGLQVREMSCNGDGRFAILASAKSEAVRTLISPDVAICADCLTELFDPHDRRFGYPFINCTNCGPRFTIVRDIPYDRPRTSMAEFAMCRQCRAEYEDPHNRRFHAQPNACWECGPKVELWDRTGRPLVSDDPIAEAVSYLQAGAVVAIKGLGGFHLAVDATNASAVQLLRQRKRRVEKPFAVMLPNVEAVAEFCELDAGEKELLNVAQRPIVLLRRKSLSLIAEAVAPFNLYLGVFLPYTPLHFLLFTNHGPRALVMTSGNLSEEPIAIDNHEAVTRLAGIADYFLVHDRKILLRCDDSVVRRVNGRPRQQRRSRGFVPAPVFLKREYPAVLAVGGELKNTICLLNGCQAFLSQHIGDLENMEAFGFFGEAIEHLQRILEIGPRVVAHDLHPDYFSTRWALAQSRLPTIAVQHHHAHIASCMAENHLEGRVIGFALDGTGFGTDGCIWGGEVLLAEYADFERAAHLLYVPLPGGSAGIREPWRMAVSYLWREFGEELLQLPIPLVNLIPPRKLQTILQMIDRGVNSPLTSSCGRLFDAVAAVSNLRQEVNYEAQAAIELEMARDTAARDQPYRFAIVERGGVLQVDPGPVFRAMVEDLRAGATPGIISQRFHDGFVDALAQVARRLRRQTSLHQVCLSGGTFQNAYLCSRLEEQLRNDGFEVFTHSEVPAGDGGLSLGQAVVAAVRTEVWCP